MLALLLLSLLLLLLPRPSPMLLLLMSKVSFEKIKLINDMLLNMLGDTPDVPRVLVGSMVDLAEQRYVSQQADVYMIK